jgi:phenylalanyl-tRNA synthetase beta chain
VQETTVKISLDWISDFVDLSGIAPETIADRLTLATAEVEGFEILHRSVAGVVIGEVVEVRPIESPSPANPQAAKLTFVTVDCGEKRYQTVCGAPNVRVGMKAPFAPAGTTLAGGVTIQSAELAGGVSEGVLCSPRELGLSHWHEGLLECPGWLENGSPLEQEIPAEDIIFEIDNKSLTHRPDLWGHYGFARELAAVFGRGLRPLPMLDLSIYDDLPSYPLDIEDYDGCPCYACIEFEVQAGVPSPLAIQRRLHALGQRTYNLMVDLTNYVMWELGQPTHAFDADRVSAIRVASMGREGTFVTLDGQERKMLPDDLLIWNEDQPVALAGIMGGLNSEVQPQTGRVLLESANFNASRIRRTSVRLDLPSESARRFEKSQPPANAKLAIARMLQLISDAEVPFEVTSALTYDGDLKENYRTLVLEPGMLERLAGAELLPGEALGILQSLGFEAYENPDGRMEVGIPPHRSEKDISIPADIVEEVLRIYGYGKIRPQLPVATREPPGTNEPLCRQHRARRLLAGAHGFHEVHNYAWTDDLWLAKLGFVPSQPIEMRNPPAKEKRLLRTTLVPNLLALVPQNRPYRDSFRLFEMGRVYWLSLEKPAWPPGLTGATQLTPSATPAALALAAAKEETEGRPPPQRIEVTRLAGVSFQQAGQPSLEEHFRAIKGVIEDLALASGMGRFTFVPSPGGDAPWQVPYHWVSIRSGDRELGGLGVLAGKIQDAVVPEGGQVVWFELEMDQIDGPIYPTVRHQPVPIYPLSWQDFSLVWDVAQGYSALDRRLAAFAHPLVRSREFVYAYKGKGLPPGKGSYTYRFWIGAADHTLATEEIEQFRAALLAFLQAAQIPLR